MAEAAQFRAWNLILTFFDRLEPYVDDAAGDRILLEPNPRNKKAVDDVFGSQFEADNLIDRHMKVVFDGDVIGCPQLAVGARIGDFPVELLGRDLIENVARRSVLL